MPPRLPLTALKPRRLPLPTLRALPTPLLRLTQTKSFHAHPRAQTKHLEEGDTVAWKHATGTAAGTVGEIKTDGVLEVEAHGKMLHKDGDKKDPAVHVLREGGTEDVVKLESQLKKVTLAEEEEGEHKRGPGRPKKEEHAEGEGEHKRGPGRPKKSETEHAAETPHRRGGRPKKGEHVENGHEKRGPGRPKKNENGDHETHKRGPGRPKKDEHENDNGHSKRGPGRPRKSENDD